MAKYEHRQELVLQGKVAEYLDEQGDSGWEHVSTFPAVIHYPSCGGAGNSMIGNITHVWVVTRLELKVH